MRITGAVCAVEDAVFGVGTVEQLELVAVHVEGVKVRVEVVDDDFDDFVFLQDDRADGAVHCGVGGVGTDGERGVESGNFLA